MIAKLRNVACLVARDPGVQALRGRRLPARSRKRMPVNSWMNVSPETAIARPATWRAESPGRSGRQGRRQFRGEGRSLLTFFIQHSIGLHIAKRASPVTIM